MNIRSSSYLAVLSCFIAVTTVMACKPADTLLHKNQANEEWRDITDSGLPRIEAANLSSLSQAGRLGPVEAAEETDSEFTMKSISGSVAIDKAKLAAAKQDKCPKLVNSPIDSTQIVRKNEVMRDTYCDYYIYPKKGQRISIESHPKQLQISTGKDHIDLTTITMFGHKADGSTFLIGDLPIPLMTRMTFNFS